MINYLHQEQNWQSQLSDLITDPLELLNLLELSTDQLLSGAILASEKFKLRVPRAFVGKMSIGDPLDPLLLQVLPHHLELEEHPEFVTDPLGEEAANQMAGVLHKYQSRFLLTLTGACAVHCRYCFRRHFPYQENLPKNDDWPQIRQYIEQNPLINEVILSGGDPLTLSNRKISLWLERLASLPQIKILRIHSRVPIVIPNRIDEELISILKNSRLRIIVVVHSNHAAELDGFTCSKLLQLSLHHITVLNQAVLLKGVNDSAKTLHELSFRLFEARVMPYYLHVLDKVKGAQHFDLRSSEIDQIYSDVLASLPGYLVPKLVREIAGEKIKHRFLGFKRSEIDNTMMNNAFSDIFQIPTVLRRYKLSFCDTNSKSLNEWISNLSIMQLGDTSKALFAALLELSELECSETLRFDLVQILHPTIENVLGSLEKNFFNQGVISSDRNEHIIELAMLLRCYFAAIYINIVRRSSDQLDNQKFSIFALNQKKNLQTARTLATFQALQQLTQLLYQQHMLYSEPVAGQWLISHQLYEAALTHKYHQTNLEQIQGSKSNSLSNISQAYAQLILMDIFNTNQIRQSEIQALFQCSFDWAKMVQILSKETDLTKYVVDTSKDHPPIYNKKQSSGFNPNVFISTNTLLDHVTATLHKNAEYISKNEKIYLTPALKFHVQTILGTTAERRHERYEYSAQLHICFGLLTAHFYLSKAKNFDETLLLEHHFNLQNESRFMSTWDKKLSGNNEESSIQRLSRESKVVYQSDILDISVNGYRIKWSGEAPKNLRTGEYILVKETSHGHWRGGVIRWLKQSTEKSLELGLEVLAQEIFPCAVRVQADRHVSNYHPALLLKNQSLDETKTTLILPGSQIFREQQAIHLRLGKEEVKVYLLNAQLITQSFVQFDFELLNEEEQSILHKFMAQNNMDTNDQDLWEALK